MADLLSQLIPALLGDAQSQSPLLLSTAYSPGGSSNLWINKLGQILPISGYLRQNPAAFTTDGGGSDAVIRALYQYRKIAAGNTTRQVLFVLDDGVNEWELHYSTDLGVAKNLIMDFGAASVGRIPDFATFGDELFFVNGVITARMWNGLVLTDVGAAQLAAPALTAGGAGNKNGSYKVRVVSLKSDGSRKPASVMSLALQVDDKQVNVAWGADADVTVVGYEVWSTTGSGLDFYRETYVDGRLTVAATLDLADWDLITREVLAVVGSHGDPPPVGAYFCVPHKGRMWWLRTDTYPRRVWWSDPGDPDSVYTERSYTECTDAESIGDQLAGGTGDFEGMIVLWMERNIWVISGTGLIQGPSIDWRKRRSNASTGTVSVRAVVRVPKGAKYADQEGVLQTINGNVLAFLTPKKDIRIFNGKDDTIISFSKSDTLQRLNTASARKAYAYADDAHGMLCWVFPSDHATEPDLTVAWNYLYGTMHEWPGTPFGHVLSAESDTETNILLAGDARVIAPRALIYRLWNGDTQDGAAITATLMTKPLFPPVLEGGPPDMGYKKALHRLNLLFAKDASPSLLTVSVLPFHAGDSDVPEIIRPSLSATSRLSIPTRQRAGDARPGHYFYGQGWRLKISSTATTGPWTLQGIEQLYRVLTGRTR